MVNYEIIEDFSIDHSLFTTPYSYGDSAGITPDFPFNPGHAGTKLAANVERIEFDCKNL